MGIFGGRAQDGDISPADVAKIVPMQSDLVREEAELTAAASDATLRRRFASVWPRDFEIPKEADKRIGAVQDAIVVQEREDVAELASRTDRIMNMSEDERKRSFGVGALPRQPGERVQAAVDLALRDVEGFESPKVGAERALERRISVWASDMNEAAKKLVAELSLSMPEWRGAAWSADMEKALSVFSVPTCSKGRRRRKDCGRASVPESPDG